MAEEEKLRRVNSPGLRANSHRLSQKTAFYPGGHGPVWALAQDTESVDLIEAFQQEGKTIVLVCHAPCALLKAKLPNGHPLIKGKQVTGFSDTEEAAVELTRIVPFLLEDELRKAGAIYSKGPDWGVYVKTDGVLITGQNPASSAEAAKVLLKLLQKKS